MKLSELYKSLGISYVTSSIKGVLPVGYGIPEFAAGGRTGRLHDPTISFIPAEDPYKTDVSSIQPKTNGVSVFGEVRTTPIQAPFYEKDKEPTPAQLLVGGFYGGKYYPSMLPIATGKPLISPEGTTPTGQLRNGNGWLESLKGWLTKDITLRDIKEDVLGTYTWQEKLVGVVPWIAAAIVAVVVLSVIKK